MTESQIIEKILEVSSKSGEKEIGEGNPYPERDLDITAVSIFESRENLEEFINEYGDSGILDEVTDFDLFRTVKERLLVGHLNSSVDCYMRETGWDLTDEESYDDWDTILYTRGEETMTVQQVWDEYFSFQDTMFREDLHEEFPYHITD